MLEFYKVLARKHRRQAIAKNSSGLKILNLEEVPAPPIIMFYKSTPSWNIERIERLNTQ